MFINIPHKETHPPREVTQKDESEEVSKISFLDSPEVVWSEPPVEQVLTYPGNGS
jgi:hypothetical protein